MDEYNITVKMGPKIPSELQAKALMDMERFFREAGLPVNVFKEMMADDSKLRRSMTPLERSKL